MIKKIVKMIYNISDLIIIVSKRTYTTQHPVHTRMNHILPKDVIINNVTYNIRNVCMYKLNDLVNKNDVI